MSRIALSSIAKWTKKVQLAAGTTADSWAPQNTGTTTQVSDPVMGLCMKMTTIAGGSQNKIDRSVNQVLAGGGIGFWINFEYPTNIRDMTILLTGDGFASYWAHTISSDGINPAGSVDSPGWHFFYRRIEQFTAQAGSPSFNSPVTTIRLICSSTVASSLRFGPIYSNMREKPKHFISFDDSNDTEYSIAFPYLAARGLKATCYCIKSAIGTANKTSLSQLKELYAAGWDIATHHENTFLGETYDVQLERLNECASYLEQNGMPRGARHFSYPLGQWDHNTYLAMQGAGIKTARTIDEAQGQTQFPENLHLVTRGGTTAPATGVAALAHVDLGIAIGAVTGTYAHRLQPSTTGGNWATAEWQTYIDGLVLRRNQGLLDIVTVSELYNNSTTEYRKILP